MTDTAPWIDPDQVAAGGGGVAGGVSAIAARIPSLDLLSSQGGNGTGFLQPVHRGIDLGRLGCVIYSANLPPRATSAALFLRFAPAILLADLFNWFASWWVVVVGCTAYLWSLEDGVFSFYGDFRSCCSAGDYGT